MTKFFATLALRRALNELKLSGRRQYQIARRAGYVHPSQLSDLVAGARPAKRDDPRVQRLCTILGVSFDEAFSAHPTDTQAATIDSSVEYADGMSPSASAPDSVDGEPGAVR